ncbi:phospholipase A1 [Acinetobacter junii SH205]|uniref:Phospholipase A1 n=2 Tax=Acinetobacter junii TaxID=40215 RepID=A0AAW5RB36_ACIJU|nr:MULTISPECIES: phospholipase A [Acinetobacter]EEY93630.1 phospholipase A1 [Acinetobacter junii SH205]MCU4396321.1 phospholipase A [Acinetobacter junii]MDA3501011.1 phospholipase A [Acinetobacter sp. AOR34_HL]MDA3508810.1 phospholipase A [Acinetobacter junii]MDA3532905.1 phospholipase A [Acinetobacter junii]
MTFKKIERAQLELSILAILSSFAASNTFAQVAEPATPATVEACVALSSSADRLACYDSIFKAPTVIEPQVTEPMVAAAPPVKSKELEKSSPESLKDKVVQKVSDLNLIGAAPKFDPNVSLLDRRWELSEESKLGVWNIRAYQPVYLLPVFWTSDKNEYPESPNPNNTVTDKQNLTSSEAKFQISLKTKAWENIFGNNGDLWLGYTQSSRWQVYNSEESRPFRETNYEPEASLMFRTNYELLGLNARLLGVTLNHQSNGRSDPLSRSWNRVIFNLGFEKDNFALMLRPWYRIEEDVKDDNNPDIKDYIGRGDLTAFYRHKENDFSLMLRHSLKGGDKSHGAVQFDWAFPIKGKLRGHLQLFEGYGESLIDYNHRATYVGLGVSLMNWY